MQATDLVPDPATTDTQRAAEVVSAIHFEQKVEQLALLWRGHQHGNRMRNDARLL